MSKKKEATTLKTDVTAGCESPLSADSATTNQSKCSPAKKSTGIRKKSACAIQGKRRIASTSSKRKGSSPETNTLDELHPVPVGAIMNAFPAETTPTAPALISITPIGVQAEAPITEAPAVVESEPVMASTTSPVADCEPETAICNVSLEYEKDVAKADALVRGRQVHSNTEPLELPALQRKTFRQNLARAWDWTRKLVGSRRSEKRLRVCETVSLGEKRFVAVIEVDGEQFLVGGASSSVATLARLEPSQKFSDVLRKRWGQDPVQA